VLPVAGAVAARRGHRRVTLIALMQDQVEALSQLGVQAAFLNSSLDARRRAMSTAGCCAAT